MERERYELDEALQEEIRSKVFGDGFMKIVQRVRRGGETFRISMRPVMIGGVKKFQAEMLDGTQVQVKNFDIPGASEGLEEIIRQKGARELHLMTAAGDLHIRVTKKGKALVSRSAPMVRDAIVPSHDRVKNVPLSRFDSGALLKAIGISAGDGSIRASMRGKYDQVNEFLRVVEDVLKDDTSVKDRPFTVVDCGCGRAYLTFALWCYLSEALGFKDVRVAGIDLKGDVIARAKAIAKNLDLEGRAVFFEGDLEKFTMDDLKSEGISSVDMVISFHACDTATDEAIAKGVEWGSKYIVSAPCCQHELQKVIAGPQSNDAFQGLLRQSILRERLCDILTDSFRAMILRMLGYRTQVIEFVSPDATARNILLKASGGLRPGQATAIGEYMNLRDFWHVVPWLETRLSARLKPMLERYV